MAMAETISIAAKETTTSILADTPFLFLPSCLLNQFLLKTNEDDISTNYHLRVYQPDPADQVFLIKKQPPTLRSMPSSSI